MKSETEKRDKNQNFSQKIALQIITFKATTIKNTTNKKWLFYKRKNAELLKGNLKNTNQLAIGLIKKSLIKKT